MLLVCDVGNTNTVVGLYAGNRSVGRWRLATDPHWTADEVRLTVRSLLADVGADPAGIEGAAAASVVPALEDPLRRGLEALLVERPVRFLTAETAPVRLDVDTPQAIGADRIANCIAGFARYGGPLLVIDFGTAVTFDLVGADGAFLGGAITPEMQTAAGALFENAAQLRPIPLCVPSSVIGKTTADCIRSGVVFGHLDLVRGLIRRFRSEVAADLRAVATGGRGEFYRREIDEIEAYEPALTLEGLRVAWAHWSSAHRGGPR